MPMESYKSEQIVTPLRQIGNLRSWRAKIISLSGCLRLVQTG